eukprot:CAMPEP_0198548174 /NCGR_PEP_ID=MMETSP1462-20131121/69301_1 /TAXON_ID=1333877 /ORGANISM="Brandtodinium nutriculum, Strain RCC3387" /LENGTH=33 /DNA_ID= /DNA_START= /DNA_END= /DNA_ORIENTATION=
MFRIIASGGNSGMSTPTPSDSCTNADASTVSAD